MTGDFDIDGFAEWLKSKDRAQSTIDTYLCGVKAFEARCGEVTAKTLAEYKDWLRANFKPKTVNVRINGIVAYCQYIGFATEVKGIKVAKTLTVENVVTHEEYEKLLNGLQNDGDERGYWIVRFLAQTGARVSEFVRLTKSGLERGYDEMFTKGKTRRIYFPAALIDESREYFQTVKGESLFTNRFGKTLTTRGVSSKLKAYAERYGIRKEAMHPHGFRHLFAKEFLRNGGELTLLSDLLGHEDLSTTAIYTRQSAGEMSNKLSEIMSGGAGLSMPANAPDIRSYGDVGNSEQNYMLRLQHEVIEAQKAALRYADMLIAEKGGAIRQ